MKAIVAVDKNWGIGKDGNLLFHIKRDMKFFKDTTMNSVVVMGRKTLESFKEGKPLSNRINIVLTRQRNYFKDDVIVVNSLDDLKNKLVNYKTEIFVIGGGEIYRELLMDCSEILVTKIDKDTEADTFFPNLDLDNNFEIIKESELMDENEIKFKFLTYKNIMNK